VACTIITNAERRKYLNRRSMCTAFAAETAAGQNSSTIFAADNARHLL
jgi:hypothetical protein